MRVKRFILLSLLLAGTVTAFGGDNAGSVALSDVPPAVQKTINVQIGDGKLGEIDRTNEDDDTVFDIDFTSKAGDERDFTVADDGTLLSVEVELAETPAAVRETIHSQASGWELEGIDKNLDDTEISFDVEVSKDGREKYFTVADDGELLSVEVALAETPAAAQATIKAQTTNGNLESIDENFDPDGNSFDVEAVMKGGGRKSFCVAADGKLLSEEVTLQRTTPRARRTIKAEIGDGRILRIDKSLLEREGGVLPYEVQGRKDGKPFDFSVGPGEDFWAWTINKMLLPISVQHPFWKGKMGDAPLRF